MSVVLAFRNVCSSAETGPRAKNTGSIPFRIYRLSFHVMGQFEWTRPLILVPPADLTLDQESDR